MDDGLPGLVGWLVTLGSKLGALGDAGAEDGKGKSAGLISCGDGALAGAATGATAGCVGVLAGTGGGAWAVPGRELTVSAWFPNGLAGSLAAFREPGRSHALAPGWRKPVVPLGVAGAVAVAVAAIKFGAEAEAGMPSGAAFC